MGCTVHFYLAIAHTSSMQELSYSPFEICALLIKTSLQGKKENVSCHSSMYEQTLIS